ncbi:MAG: SDR family oxidoreductase, partial [Pseudomonadota bacterium]|nr:SDR family oxidoreductase [Pseudomonadota bacterium]
EREMDEDEKDKLISSIPLGELGTPNDIAKTLSFLASAPYITGQIIYVDGGRGLHTGASA